MDRGVWKSIVHGITKSYTWLSYWQQHNTYENVSHSILSTSLQPIDCSLGGSSVHGILQARTYKIYKLYVYDWYMYIHTHNRIRSILSALISTLLYYCFISFHSIAKCVKIYSEYKKINDHPEILPAVVFHKWYSIVNAVRIYWSVLPGVYQRWIEIDKIDINILSPVAYVKFFLRIVFLFLVKMSMWI